MSKFPSIFIAVLTLLILGCGKTYNITMPGLDEADKSLSEAASIIQQDIKMMHGAQYVGPAPLGTTPLMGTSIYRYTGEAEGAIKEISLKTGYAMKTTGKPHNQALMVKIYTVKPQTWFDTLQSIGTQLGDRADLHVDEGSRTITLAYGGLKKEPSPVVKKPIAKKASPKKKIVKKTPVKKQIIKKASPESLLVFKGDLSDCHLEIAKKLGYKAVVEGTRSDIPINLSSGQRTWTEIVNLINSKAKTASMFMDDANKTVVLKYWR